MIVIFCISNLSVPVTITIIEENKATDFIVITDQPSIYQLLKELYNETHLLLIKKTKFFNHFHSLFFPLNILFLKYKYNRFIKKIENANIFFFFNAFGLFESWMIKEFSKKSSIFYKPDLSIKNWTCKYSFTSKLKQYYIKVLYGIWTESIWTGERFIPAVSEEFLNSICAKSICLNVNLSVLEKVVLKLIKVEKLDILYLTGGLIESGIIEKSEFIEKTDNLLLNLKDYNIVIKCHPRFTTLYSQEKEFTKIDSYIPANLLIYIVKIVIGYSSSTLFEAANIDVCPISLLEFFKPINNERLISYKEYLQINSINKNINYPITIDEIKQIIDEKLKINK